MKLLLDTHVLLWALLEPQKLSPELHNALDTVWRRSICRSALPWPVRPACGPCRTEILLIVF